MGLFYVPNCTGNSHAAQEDACRILQGLPPLLGSRLFVYYNARLAAQIADAINALRNQGTQTVTLPRQ